MLLLRNSNPPYHPLCMLYVSSNFAMRVLFAVGAPIQETPAMILVGVAYLNCQRNEFSSCEFDISYLPYFKEGGKMNLAPHC